jgi:ABC-type multidrug transport system ATPase subunit
VQDVMELCTNMAIMHQGRVLYAGSPEAAVETLAGSIWQRFVPKADFEEYTKAHRVISSKLIGGRPLIHIYSSESPGDGFEPVRPDLEDVFFTKISGLA